MACIRCVFPRPTPPYMNNGLYALAGESLTARDAALAKRFDGPTTKLSNVYLGLRPISLRASDLSLGEKTPFRNPFGCLESAPSDRANISSSPPSFTTNSTSRLAPEAWARDCFTSGRYLSTSQSLKYLLGASSFIETGPCERNLMGPNQIWKTCSLLTAPRISSSVRVQPLF